MAAPKNNDYTRKYTDDDALEYFNKALTYSVEDDECLCIQDAIFHCGMPYSTFYDLASKSKVLETIKKDIAENVIRRVNKGGLKSKLNPAMSIWRLKQMGEKDKQEIDHTSQGEHINKSPIEFVKSKNDNQD